METNPELWERIKREAHEAGEDPYERLTQHVEHDPKQFRRAKRERDMKSKRGE